MSDHLCISSSIKQKLVQSRSRLASILLDCLLFISRIIWCGEVEDSNLRALR
ncbi:hypothetical protein PRUPE_2G079200 [Prunus persica]|uniref:Uncharacterized protein n=1 Tax=Prunus persica TaxID=3760 RepID=A0A251QCY8_PRUPE|nr:hypothetical protein PRUPE_2G079200 [Prunus persica]ONI21660.1 hypothetical protein PRUPE_2G079200 [Prunus persica]